MVGAGLALVTDQEFLAYRVYALVGVDDLAGGGKPDASGRFAHQLLKKIQIADRDLFRPEIRREKFHHRGTELTERLFLIFD
jgi:hypothetical protein